MAEETYQTSDLLEALALSISDCTIKSVQPKGKKTEFYFAKNEKLSQVLSAYEKRELKYDAQTFLKGMRNFAQVHHIEFTRFQ